MTLTVERVSQEFRNVIERFFKENVTFTEDDLFVSVAKSLNILPEKEKYAQIVSTILRDRKPSNYRQAALFRGNKDYVELVYHPDFIDPELYDSSGFIVGNAVDGKLEPALTKLSFATDPAHATLRSRGFVSRDRLATPVPTPTVDYEPKDFEIVNINYDEKTIHVKLDIDSFSKDDRESGIEFFQGIFYGAFDLEADQLRSVIMEDSITGHTVVVNPNNINSARRHAITQPTAALNMPMPDAIWTGTTDTDGRLRIPAKTTAQMIGAKFSIILYDADSGEFSVRLG